MSERQPDIAVGKEEKFLSGAYPRILRNTLALSILATLGASIFFGWRCGLGVAMGAATAYLNLRWLHHGTSLIVDRMLVAGSISKARLWLAFLGRFGFMLAIACVIFVSSRLVFYGFVASLVLPIAGAVCEAGYEALRGRNPSEKQN